MRCSCLFMTFGSSTSWICVTGWNPAGQSLRLSRISHFWSSVVWKSDVSSETLWSPFSLCALTVTLRWSSRSSWRPTFMAPFWQVSRAAASVWVCECDRNACYSVFPLFCPTVVRSSCPSYVGTTGILVQELKHVFRIITKEDRLKSKRHFCACEHVWACASVIITGVVLYLFCGSKWFFRWSSVKVELQSLLLQVLRFQVMLKCLLKINYAMSLCKLVIWDVLLNQKFMMIMLMVIIIYSSSDDRFVCVCMFVCFCLYVFVCVFACACALNHQLSRRGTVCSVWKWETSSLRSMGAGLSCAPANARPRNSKSEGLSTYSRLKCSRDLQSSLTLQHFTASHFIYNLYLLMSICIYGEMYFMSCPHGGALMAFILCTFFFSIIIFCCKFVL